MDVERPGHATPRGVAAGLGDRLERVIRQGMIEPAFQPIVDVELGRITGFEALTRPTPPSGFSNAGELFDGAAALDRLWDLEAVTRRAALAGATAWEDGVLLFLNCSPQVFADARFGPDLVASVAGTPGLSPTRVVLEITERSEQLHVDGLTEQVGRLKEAGFQIAIDDVGAGTSGLTRIMRLRPHWLKLDRDLIEWIDRDRVKQNMIRFLVHFARLSGVRIVGEGVERERELATLVDLGVTCVQGFYLGRPGARDQTLAPALAAWVTERCATARTKRTGEPLGNRVLRLARPAIVVEAREPIASVVRRLGEDAGAPGAVVQRGGRLLGWCPRRAAQEHHDRGNGHAAVETITPPGSAALDPEATITDALDIAGARDEQGLHTPLVVAGGGRVQGIVVLRDLLAAAAELTRSPGARTDPVTGLPGRVRADEHVAHLIGASVRSPVRRPTDAAVIDMRRFSDFNAAYGYELGDQLLQDLCNLIQLTIGRSDGVFLAHVGDDRFLVTAAADLLDQRIPVLAQQFDRVVDGYLQGLLLGPEPAAAGPASAAGIGLRIIVLPDVFGRISTPSALYHLAGAVRNPRPEDGRSLAGSRCVIIRAEAPPLAKAA